MYRLKAKAKRKKSLYNKHLAMKIYWDGMD